MRAPITWTRAAFQHVSNQTSNSTQKPHPGQTYALLRHSCQSTGVGSARGGPWAAPRGRVPAGASRRSSPLFACARHSARLQWPRLHISACSTTAPSPPAIHARAALCAEMFCGRPRNVESARDASASSGERLERNLHSEKQPVSQSQLYSCPLVGCRIVPWGE